MTSLLPLVVVIEGDVATLTALGRVLSAGGFEAATYRSAEAFLDVPPARLPLCLVTEAQPGKMSGLELMRRLRALGSTIPVIVMTAFDDAGVRAEARRMGCAGYLQKSSDVERLLDLLQSIQSS